MSAPAFSIHPLAFLAIQKSTIIALLAFTPSGSILRPSLFPVLLICNYKLLHSYTLYIPRSAWIGFVSGEILAGPLDYMEKLLLSRWNFSDKGPSGETSTLDATRNKDGGRVSGEKRKQAQRAALFTPSPSLTDTWERVKFGTWVAMSSRYINSPYQARNTPPYSTSNPASIPSRRTFLLRCSSIFLACYLVTDLLLLGNRPASNPILYAQEQALLFPRLLTHDLHVPAANFLTRCSTTLGFWFGGYVIIQGYYSAAAFLAVGFGFTTSADCRPIFGSLGDAYTIRRFWGIFWHQLMRKKLTTIAYWLTYDILLIPRSFQVVARYTELIFAFLVSGILHQTIEVAQGMRWSDSGALQFYILMAGGIVVEDGIVWAWCLTSGCVHVKKQRVENRESEPQAGVLGWQKVLGFVWVALFFSWATPVWVYPQLRRNTGAVSDCPLPLSIIQVVKSRLK